MIGETFSHYKVVSKLGEGGMGEVYLAEDTELERNVALKVLPPSMADDPERLERFQREAKAVAALNHPNIVTIYNIEEDGGRRFLIMEHIDGDSLDRIVPPGGLPLTRVFDIAVPMANALAAAHERGIVHRDLKPANVMVTRDGRVKVLDFGLAKLAVEAIMPSEDQATQAAEPTAGLTGEGTVMGTAPYMSPEQLQAHAVDHRTDIFSLGIVMYEMVTGRRPFQGDSGIALASSVLKDNPVPITEMRDELPRHLGRVIHRCLEKEPRERYQSALDVHNELKGLRKEVESGSATVVSGTVPAAQAPGSGPVSDVAAGSSGSGSGSEVAAQPSAAAPLTAGPGAVPGPTTAEPVDPTSGPASGPASAVASGAVPAASGSRKSLLGILGAVVVLALLVGWWLGRSKSEPETAPTRVESTQAPTPAPAATNSVAVLPFKNMSADEENEYFAEGLTEELHNVLVKIPELKVAGRTSANAFKDTEEDLRSVGQQLGVATILEGSVRKSDDQVRISANLVNVEDGFDLWSETYDRTLEDIFVVQDDIATSVAEALKVTLLGGAQAAAQDASAEAFNLMLQSRYLLQKQTVEDTHKAMDLLQEAQTISPNYAPVWAELGLGYARLAELSTSPREADEYTLKQSQALDKALELDPNLAIAYSRRGVNDMRREFDFEKAEVSIRRALELEPNNPRVIHNSAMVIGSMGNLDESIELYRRALEIDPLNLVTYMNLGTAYFAADRLEDAETALKKVIELNPEAPLIRGFLGNVYLVQRRPKAALTEYNQEGFRPLHLNGRILALDALGDRAAADEALTEMQAEFGDDENLRPGRGQEQRLAQASPHRLTLAALPREDEPGRLRLLRARSSWYRRTVFAPLR
jgi:serine/threonine-protein kinase